MTDPNSRQPPRLSGLISSTGIEAQASGLNSFDYDTTNSRIAGFGCPRMKWEGQWISPDQESFGAKLISLWEQHGTAILEHLDGDYLLLAWSRGNAKALVSVDRFSTHALYWRADGDRVAFSSHAVEVSTLLGEVPKFNNDALYAYLYFHVIPAPLSIVQGVHRLDIGQALAVQKGRAEVIVHWRPQFDEHAGFSFQREKAGFFEGLRSGVQANVAGLNPSETGCFLSGGTDSSTLAGILTEVQGRGARTFSIVFDEAKYDEREFSRCAASHFGTDHTEHVLTPEQTESAIHTIAASYEQPFGNSSAVPTLVCADLARRHGVQRMLGGDGGDELFGGNTRYARAWVLSHYDKLPLSLRQSVLEPLLLRGPAADSSYWPIRKLRGYVEQAREPLPGQLDSRYNLLNRLGPQNMLTAAFLSGVSLRTSTGLQREVWDQTAQSEALINQLLAYDFKFTLGDNDLPKVTRMCHAAGVSVGFPMLCHELVSLAEKLPASQKIRGTHLRRFFRQALRDYLPDSILEKSKHGFGMPFGEWLLSQPVLSGLAYETLDSLVQRGLINATFVTEMKAKIAGGHAGYYGTLVWVLMMFELWLRESPFSGIDWLDSTRL